MLYGNSQCSQNLECCHIHSRRHQYLRHNPLNVLSMCSAHHRWYTDHPTMFADFINRKWPKGMKAEARAHYRKELERSIEARCLGETGEIQVTGFL